jgi:hypothetical protein
MTAIALSLALCAGAASAAAGRARDTPTPRRLSASGRLNKEASDPSHERPGGDEHRRGGDHAGRGRGWRDSGGAVVGAAVAGAAAARTPGCAPPDRGGPRHHRHARSPDHRADRIADHHHDQRRSHDASPDSKKIKDESTGFERKTRRESGASSARSPAAPARSSETYAIDPEHHRLTATVRIDNPKLPNGGVTHRVYDADQTQ